MSEVQMRYYGPGDTVRMSVGVQHRMHLMEVSATFLHEEKNEAFIVLSGEPDLSEDQWARSQGIMRSEAELVQRLSPEVVPGVYRLHRIAFFTYVGKAFVHRGEEELGESASVRFEVLPEPEEKPALEGLDFL